MVTLEREMQAPAGAVGAAEPQSVVVNTSNQKPNSASLPSATLPVAAMQQPNNAPPPDAVGEPLAYLEHLLGKIAALDKERFFQAPVDEAYAPKYYEIIQHPMCFDVMKQRLAGDQYQTFKALRDDFELICANARKYNHKKTAVNKLATALARNGSKLLKQHELDMRKAFSLLHPEAQAADTDALILAPTPEHSVSGQGVAADIKCEQGQEVNQPQGAALADEAGHGHGAPGSHPPGPAPAPTLHLQRQPICTYVSDDEGSVDDVVLPASIDPACSMEVLLQQSKLPVLFEPYPPRAAAAGATSGAEAAGACAPSTSGGAAQQGEDGASGRRTAAWKNERGSIAWRCRWVELRLRQLQSQRAQLSEALAALAAPSSSGAAAADAAGAAAETALPEAPAPEPPPAAAAAGPSRELAQQLEQLQAAAQLVQLTCGLSPSPWHSAHLRPYGEDPQAEALPQPMDTANEDAATPGGVAAVLDLLDLQLLQLKAHLVHAFNLDSARVAAVLMGPPQQPLAQGGHHPEEAQHGRQQAPLRRNSMLPASRPGPLHISRSELLKRRRAGGDGGDDVTTPTSARGLDRQPSTIAIPPVRPLPDSEVDAREAAMGPWRQRYQHEGPNALRRPPSDVEAVLDDCEEAEGSSSEDTSDEAYAKLHAPLERQEHQRYAGWDQEAQRMRRSASKATQGKGGKGKGKGSRPGAAPRHPGAAGPGDTHHPMHHHPSSMQLGSPTGAIAAEDMGPSDGEQLHSPDGVVHAGGNGELDEAGGAAAAAEGQAPASALKQGGPRPGGAAAASSRILTAAARSGRGRGPGAAGQPRAPFRPGGSNGH